MRTLFPVALAALVAGVLPASADAQNSNFDPRPIVFGEERDQIKSTPIEQRPNRPLHFYGNTVRRRHQREMQPARSQRTPTRATSTRR